MPDNERGILIREESPIRVTDQISVEYRLTCWENCEKECRTIEDRHRGSGSEVWFRGQASSRWKLESALERRVGGEYPIANYLRLLNRLRREIESFTGREWQSPSHETITKWTSEYDELSRVLLAGDPRFQYEYMAYLRHYGFPSPFLDWTSLPYIAAYFAFAGARPNADAAIYAFVERPNKLKVGGSGQPAIHVVGPHIGAPRRHFLQKSRYTLCVQFEADAGWRFVPHQKVVDQSRIDQDVTWKFVIPPTERPKVLSVLDRYNLNQYSLFGSEESLMETLALREFDLGAVTSAIT